MKVAYFDCFSGISGDMILGSLIDAGLSHHILLKHLERLPLPGFSVQIEKVTKCGISGTKVNVLTQDCHTHRHLQDIYSILEQSKLEHDVIKTAKKIFQNLAQAEAKVHNTTPDNIHFHEVGAVDAIVDIVGAVVGLKELGIEEIYVSPLNLGSGFVECEHGTIPVPAPATVELLKGVPSYTSDVRQELVTPTGAAIITTLAKEFGSMPELVVDCAGYGAGERDLKIPNLLRVIVGEHKQISNYHTDKNIILETNIDDMNPEFFDFLFYRLSKEGALDVSLTPIYMKKNRPGTLLRVLAKENNKDNLIKAIFEETTTLGIRTYSANQISLPLEFRPIETKYGTIRIKIKKISGKSTQVLPVYEDCRLAAIKYGLPVKHVYDEVVREGLAKIDFGT
ncbi:MAG: nickel pincer cofactor biosynthesis protein LarC [Zhaonellaceae bacterium]|nr:nickel pincer cofactor biosynthesis protein LarC [Clostridia bacterium]